MNTNTENFLLQKFGPLLSLAQLAGLLDRSVVGLRIAAPVGWSDPLTTAAFAAKGTQWFFRKKVTREWGAG